jgi:hypothetical protein
MRNLKEIRSDLALLVHEYKRCKRGNNKVRFVLCNAFKMYWLLLEINTVIENE